MASWFKVNPRDNRNAFVSCDSDVILDEYENGAAITKVESVECTKLLTCGCGQCKTVAMSELEIYAEVEA